MGAVTPGQLFTAWDKKKLERTVVGASIAFPGKRVDALLHTSGVVRSLVFAEFKTHRTALLGKEYRSGCFAPSDELAGGVSQVQGTVHLAATTISDQLAEIDLDGAEIPGRFTYLIRPRSFLVIGHLGKLKGEAGGDHAAKIRSFEPYRRHLDAPEIVTFDELLARAEWAIQMGTAVE
ncbi:Shedu immune nuclease family protein [Nonomuraea sp. NPDC003709]|uniref:Shedu immune nuclease family protein n=1 Tax=Nonomuraea sp. NPDC003709 TaxID=3154450 RepID=UPI0033B71F5B